MRKKTKIRTSPKDHLSPQPPSSVESETDTERNQSLSILKQFIRHFVSIVVKWRLYPSCDSYFKDKYYAGLHLKYMDPVGKNLQILNDDIYNITQWIEQGVIQNISSLKSFDLLLFHHERATLESFTIHLSDDNSKSMNDVNSERIGRPKGSMKTQIRAVLEETLHLLKRTTDDYHGKVSMNVITKNQSTNTDFMVNEQIMEETRRHPMETILLNRSENDSVTMEKKERNEDLKYLVDELPLCQNSIDSTSPSDSTRSHMNFQSHAVHENHSIRLGHAQFPCHGVVIFQQASKVDAYNQDHCDEIQRMFHVDLHSHSIKNFDADQFDRKSGIFNVKQKNDTKTLVRQEKRRSKSPPHILSPNTPHPASIKEENTPRLNKRKRSPVSSPRRSMQFGDTPVLRRRHHEEETNQVSIISPKIDSGKDHRTPRSGSSSEAPTMVVNFSTSGSRGTNISPYSYQQRNIGRNSSPLPASKFHFSQDENDVME
jgi:hypothetical protein